MKTLFLRTLLIVTMTVLGTLRSQSQTVEVTDEFKQLIKELAREEFRSYVYNKLKDDDPIIAASAYDLIERVISGDSISGIGKQIIISTIDYSLFIELEKSLRDYVPSDSVVTEDNKPIERSDYSRLMKVGALLVYEKIARDNYLIVGTGLRQMLAEETKFVSKHKVGISRTMFGLVTYDFLTTNESSVAKLLKTVAMLKNVVLSATLSDTSAIFNLKPYYESVVNQQFASTQLFLSDALEKLKARLDLIVNAYDSMLKNKYASIFRDIVPYIYNDVVQKLQRIPVDYNKETVKMLTLRLSSINSEDKTGFKYKIGLWAGLFVDGKAWNPPTSNNFIVSLRINDRLQYTWAGGANYDVFIYVGGFVDAALKEIAKSTANEFGFGGIGYSYKSVTFTVSGFVPINGVGSRSGVVFTTMYDLPIEKIIHVF